jgi:hypothetical protein
MNDLDVFKRRVGYRLQADQDTFTGDGSAVTVNLRHENVSDVVVFVGNDQQTVNEDYTVSSAPGVITFTEPVPDGSVATID